MDDYDKKYPEEALKQIDGCLASAVMVLRCARDLIVDSQQNQNFNRPRESAENENGYDSGCECAIDHINSLIHDLICDCVEK